MEERHASRGRTAGALLGACLAAALWSAPAKGAQAAPAPGAAPQAEPHSAPGRQADASAPGKAPTAEEVAIALADLAQGLKAATPGERAEVVARNAGVADAKVVKALAKYLKDKEPAPRLAALAALGQTPHAEALKELHRALSDDKLMADEALGAALLVAIGRHADASSVKALGTDAWKHPAADVARARLLALGAIRTKASVELLMELMNTEPTLPWDVSPYLQDFRLALARLTGVDKGIDKEAWRAWWREAGKTLKVAPEPPELVPELQSRWDAFWALPERPVAAPREAAPAPEGAPGS